MTKRKQIVNLVAEGKLNKYYFIKQNKINMAGIANENICKQ